MYLPCKKLPSRVITWNTCVHCDFVESNPFMNILHLHLKPLISHFICILYLTCIYCCKLSQYHDRHHQLIHVLLLCLFDAHMISHLCWIFQQVQNNWMVLHKILTLIYVYARTVEDAHTTVKAHGSWCLWRWTSHHHLLEQLNCS